MASQTKLADKQKELQAKYGNNKQKYNEELMKLYEKEGVNPSSGCLTTLLPLPIMLGIYYSRDYASVQHAAHRFGAHCGGHRFHQPHPGMVASATSGGIYSEMEIIRNFDALKDHLTMFTPEDLDKIESFTQGLPLFGAGPAGYPSERRFFGFPLDHPGAVPYQQLWVPDVYVPLSKGPQRADTAWLHEGHDVFPPFNQRVLGLDHAQRRGPVLGDFFRHQFLQSLITNKYFSIDHMIARGEAQRAVTLELAEAKARPLPAATQKEIAEKLAAAPQQQKLEKGGGKKQQGGKKNKGGSGALGTPARIWAQRR